MIDAPFDDNFNIYDLNVYTGEFRLLKDGVDDQPNLFYEYPSNDIKNLVKNLLYASDFVKLVKLFQINIVKYHTYTFSKSDKPNMKSDDAILKREYVDFS